MTPDPKDRERALRYALEDEPDAHYWTNRAWFAEQIRARYPDATKFDATTLSAECCAFLAGLANREDKP